MRRIPCLFLLGLVAACQTNPITGRQQLLIFSESHMIKLGAEAYLQMTSSDQVKVSTDPRLTAPLQRVGMAISAAANKPDYQWEFKLIDDKETVNAWALPGGKIAFYTGIYPILQDEAGMAIVMGHEVMHAMLRHGNERMSQGLVAQAALVGLSEGLRNDKDRDTYMLLATGAAVYGAILPYSRSHESEADRFGLFLAARAGYDPEAAVGVWQRMAELGKGQRPPEFFSTHPDPLKRIEKMREWMPEAKRLYEQSSKQPNQPLPRIQ